MIKWEGVRIPLEKYSGYKCNAIDKRTISNNSYVSMTIKQIIDHTEQDSLSNEQKRQTSLLLSKYERLFNGNI